MFVEEVAASGDLINGRLDGANIATERCGDKGTEKAHDASDDFVGGHFGGGPVELEETGVDIIIGSEEEIEGFETNKSKGEAEVQIVKTIEAEEHGGDSAVDDEEEPAGVLSGLFKVKTMFANVDFDQSVDRLEDVPLGIGDELREGDGKTVLRAEFQGVAQTKEEDEKRREMANEASRVVFDTTGEVEAEVKFIAVFGKDKDSIECHDGDSDADDDELTLSDESGADEDTEIKKVEGDGIAVGAGILVFVVEFFEDEREDSLNDENKDRIDGKSAVDGGVHAHELDKRVDIEYSETVDKNSQSNANDHAGHDGVGIFVAGFADVGPNGERATNDTINT